MADDMSWGDPLNQGPVLSEQERTWGMIAHVAAFAGFVVPFGSVLGPLVVWLMKRDSMPHVDREGKEALNFNLSFLIYFVISIVLILVLVGILLVIAAAVTWLVLVITATVKASNGESYRYPLTMRFIT